MATQKTETFDDGQFVKLVALFDSNNPGEAENAFRRAVLMCAKNGLRFGDAAGTVFAGQSGRVAELEEQLQRQEAEWAPKLDFASEEIERLKQELAEAHAANQIPDGAHVIDLPGRLRRAWQFAQFRLFILTLAIFAAVCAGEAGQKGATGVFGCLCVFLFGCWSVAQFRWQGFAPMLLKWLVYGVMLLAAGVAHDNVPPENRAPVIVFLLAASLVLTLSQASVWLGGLIRAHIWESGTMRTVRRWFRP